MVGGVKVIYAILLALVLIVGASLTCYIVTHKKFDEVMEDIPSAEDIHSASVLTADDPSVAIDDHNKTDDDNGTTNNTARRDDGGKSNGSSTNSLNPDDPEELVPIVDAADEAVANRSVMVNPKGTQGKRYIVVEVYMQRSEPKDIRFKERAAKHTKRLQEIVTRELEGHTIEDLQKPITKEFIRRTLQKKFNGLLEGDGFHTPVGKVVFSKWIMQ